MTVAQDTLSAALAAMEQRTGGFLTASMYGSLVESSILPLLGADTHVEAVVPVARDLGADLTLEPISPSDRIVSGLVVFTSDLLVIASIDDGSASHDPSVAVPVGSVAATREVVVESGGVRVDGHVVETPGASYLLMVPNNEQLPASVREEWDRTLAARLVGPTANPPALVAFDLDEETIARPRPAPVVLPPPDPATIRPAVREEAGVERLPPSAGRRPRQVEPGWYPHPYDDGARAYWDGGAWTGAEDGGLVDLPSPGATLGNPPSVPGPTVIPPGVLAVAVLLVGVAALLFVPMAPDLPDLVSGLFSGDEFTRAWSALIGIVVAVVLWMVVACAWLAVALWRADRVGQMLTVVLAVMVAISLVTVESRTTAETVALVGSIGVVLALLLPQSSRTWFASKYSAVPVSVDAARALSVALAGFVGLAGLMFLAAGSVDGKYYVIGLGLVGGCGAVLATHTRLVEGDESARLVVSGAMAAACVLFLWNATTGYNLLPAGLAAAAVGLLWLPKDAQEHFA